MRVRSCRLSARGNMRDGAAFHFLPFFPDSKLLLQLSRPRFIFMDSIWMFQSFLCHTEVRLQCQVPILFNKSALFADLAQSFFFVVVVVVKSDTGWCRLFIYLYISLPQFQRAACRVRPFCLFRFGITPNLIFKKDTHKKPRTVDSECYTLNKRLAAFATQEFYLFSNCKHAVRVALALHRGQVFDLVTPGSLGSARLLSGQIEQAY